MTKPNQNDLIVFTDEDGAPWAAFVWGEADPTAVADLIDLDVIAEETGYEPEDIIAECSWPPRVQTYHLQLNEDETYSFCDASDPEAQIITGHRFYPQGF